MFPYAFAANELALRLQDNGLQLALFNAPPGNWEAGERGLACLPGREAGSQRLCAGTRLCAGAALPPHPCDGGPGPAGAAHQLLQATCTWTTWPGPPAKQRAQGWMC